MPGNIGPMELVIVLVIVLLLVGARRLPQLGASIGQGVRQFRTGLIGDNGAPEDIRASEDRS
ncbi:MAG: twin-arginine translocase TatA/TatE family subunit [Gemmatimonadaceae bacterium]